MSNNVNGLMKRASVLALGLLFVLPAAGMAQDGNWRDEQRREERREQRPHRAGAVEPATTCRPLGGGQPGREGRGGLDTHRPSLSSRSSRNCSETKKSMITVRTTTSAAPRFLLP